MLHLFKSLTNTVLCLTVAFAAGLPVEDDDRAQDLFAQHRWFDLRDSTVIDRYAAPLIKGTLASAFNRPAEAERQLKLAIHLAKGTDQVNAAREKLLVLYLRQGRTRDAVAQMKAALKRDSGRADLQGLLDLFGPLISYPSVAVRLPRGAANLPCEVKADGVWLVASVNGKKVTWLLDTGANFSFISESEAASLGIVAHDGGGAMNDNAGGNVKTKTGVAAKIQIGGVELRNVPVLISSDGRPPWTEWAAGRRGVFGLPVAIAMQTIGWARDGTCQTGVEQNAPGLSNLAFDDLNPVLRGTLHAKPVEWLLDTGNQSGTQLWTRFKGDFPEIVAGEGVIAGKETVAQAGGTNERPTTVIPELKCEVGGFQALLKPAHLFGKPLGNDYYHGLLGMDVYSQAREIILDFRHMTFTAR